MKRILTSIGVFMLIICVDSLIELESTIPQQNTFPALILRIYQVLGHRPLVPLEVKENKSTNAKMFKYETVEKGLNAFQNHSLTYQCPVGKGAEELKDSKEMQCENELKVTVYENGKRCGNENRKEYNIGYGIGEKSIRVLTQYFSHDKNSQEKNRVRWWLYTSCFDEEEDRVYVVKYELRGRNNLYHQSNTIYPQEVQKKIFELDSIYRAKMMEKLHLSHRKSGKVIVERNDLIPFQLVSHEDMILYNLKLATFDEKNYSYIFTNVAEKSWKSINMHLRDYMKKCNPDLEVYSGVHDFTDEGYPRYIWKFLTHRRYGIAVVIHNQPKGDPEDYPHLCEDAPNNCEGYGLLANEIHKNDGLSYCCPAKYLTDKIGFIKDNFSKLKAEGLELPDMVSIDDSADPRSIEYVRKPETTNSSSKPTSSTSSIYVANAAPYNSNFRRFRTPTASQSNRPEPSKSSAPNDNDAVRKVQEKLAIWSPPNSVEKPNP